MSQLKEGSFEPRPVDDNEIFVKNVGGEEIKTIWYWF